MDGSEFECPVPSAMDDYDRLRRKRGEGMHLPLRAVLMDDRDRRCAALPPDHEPWECE